MKTGIIIPCYNEEKRLDTEAFVSFIKANYNYHLCFVNDGSKDNTLKVLHSMKQQQPHNISVVDVKRNVGKAAAVRAGVRYLYHRSDIISIGFMDADLSTDFKDFKDLVKTLHSNEQLSVVFGSRNTGGNGIKRDAFRNVMSKMIKKFILMILGLPIRDTQCGAKVFSKNIVPIVYGEAFESRWLFDVEIFLRLKKYLGKKAVMNHIFEQPLMRWVHVEDSKLGMKDSLLIPMRLFKIWTAYSLFQKLNVAAPSDGFVLEQEMIGKTQLSIAA
ncbi:glycosyltransferase family 2 protein [Aureitalea sp. L0-47]|uniref:dolichyl-phosphate beta-glucosyltransferase n=1 Tax=Aureitalea sp. L0-47 TaxID=2816962 RepID=UPI00223723EF|nr:dolichyl-phosphate beta-glucosyltransferase [Aureitalea sp. L0-47]MCW5518605.1 glycosyltransferase family 2 protein [Aureitalea sp. L0-47]